MTKLHSRFQFESEVLFPNKLYWFLCYVSGSFGIAIGFKNHFILRQDHSLVSFSGLAFIDRFVRFSSTFSLFLITPIEKSNSFAYIENLTHFDTEKENSKYHFLKIRFRVQF